MNAQEVVRRLNESLSNDDLWTNPSIVDDVEDLADEYDALRAENAKLRDFIELLLSCPRDSGECKECRRLNDLCVVELEAGKLGVEVEE